MKRYTLVLLLLLLGFLSVGPRAANAGSTTVNFTFDGRPAYIIIPDSYRSDKPWIWRSRWPSFYTEHEMTLVNDCGFYVAYLDLSNWYGSPDSVVRWTAFYNYLRSEYGLHEKPSIRCVSRGGLHAYNWAKANTNKVSSIIGISPVLDFKSWPGGYGQFEGNASAWSTCKAAYGFADDAAAEAWTGNPTVSVGPIATAGIPLLHYVWTGDTTVYYDENSQLMTNNFPALNMTLVVGEGGTHQSKPSDPQPLIDFILDSLPAGTNVLVEPTLPPPAYYRATGTNVLDVFEDGDLATGGVGMTGWQATIDDRGNQSETNGLGHFFSGSGAISMTTIGGGLSVPAMLVGDSATYTWNIAAFTSDGDGRGYFGLIDQTPNPGASNYKYGESGEFAFIVAVDTLVDDTGVTFFPADGSGGAGIFYRKNDEAWTQAAKFSFDSYDLTSGGPMDLSITLTRTATGIDYAVDFGDVDVTVVSGYGKESLTGSATNFTPTDLRGMVYSQAFGADGGPSVETYSRVDTLRPPDAEIYDEFDNEDLATGGVGMIGWQATLDATGNESETNGLGRFFSGGNAISMTTIGGGVDISALNAATVVIHTWNIAAFAGSGDDGRGYFGLIDQTDGDHRYGEVDEYAFIVAVDTKAVDTSTAAGVDFPGDGTGGAGIFYRMNDEAWTHAAKVSLDSYSLTDGGPMTLSIQLTRTETGVDYAVSFGAESVTVSAGSLSGSATNFTPTDLRGMVFSQSFGADGGPSVERYSVGTYYPPPKGTVIVVQ